MVDRASRTKASHWPAKSLCNAHHELSATILEVVALNRGPSDLCGKYSARSAP